MGARDPKRSIATKQYLVVAIKVHRIAEMHKQIWVPLICPRVVAVQGRQRGGKGVGQCWQR